MTIWVHTNGRPSNGAKALASQPGFKRCITGNGIQFDDVLLNWGSSKYIHTAKDCGRTLNYVLPVSIATNKLSFFEYLFGPESNNPVDGVFVKTPEFTTKQEVAQQWSDEGSTVVVREKLTGHSGDGIIIVEKGEQVPAAPLYTKYIFKEKEFRVHVVGKKVIDTQRKIKDPDREVVTWKVRSHANGFIYARNNIDPSPERDSLAIAAIKAVGLHFGAVDIIQDKAGVYYVLEINTAPGLEGQTVESYAKAFREWVDGGE
jgi:hypothetical protein